MSDVEDQRLIRQLLMAAALAADPARATRMDHGLSGDLVVRLETTPPLYGKIGGGSRISHAELGREIAALDWLTGRALVPRLAWSGWVDGRPAMLTEAVAGAPLHELADADAEAGAIAAIHALAALHALPTQACPFDERLGIKLAEAERRVASGEVREDDLDADLAGRSLSDLSAELLARRPTGEDLVFTHGDASWPNFILRPDGAVAMIDLGRAGVADRYQDLALFVRSGARNFPHLPVRALLEAHYPLAELDEAKLDFYRLLDEFY